MRFVILLLFEDIGDKVVFDWFESRCGVIFLLFKGWWLVFFDLYLLLMGELGVVLIYKECCCLVIFVFYSLFLKFI